MSKYNKKRPEKLFSQKGKEDKKEQQEMSQTTKKRKKGRHMGNSKDWGAPQGTLSTKSTGKSSVRGQRKEQKNAPQV